MKMRQKGTEGEKRTMEVTAVGADIDAGDAKQ